VPSPLTPSVPSSTITQSNTKTNTSIPQYSNNNTAVNVGAIIGSLFGGILLTIGSFFLYKWYKNQKKQNFGDKRNIYPQEILQIPGERTIHYYESQQAKLSTQIQPINNHVIPNTAQNVDQNTLQSLIIDLKTVKEELNNLRSSQYNAQHNVDSTRNFN
jgi:hypothetical protein